MRASRLVPTAVLGAALLATTGCGGGPGDARPSAPATATSSAPSPAPEGNGVAVPPLPDLSSLPSRSPKADSPKPSSIPGKRYGARVFGADASWPQCPKGMGIPEKRSEGLPMPTSAAKFVILGLTNGPSFVANPCLASQVGFVRQRHLLGAAYAVVSYPDDRTLARLRSQGPYDGGTRLGALHNVGYQAAGFNVATMKRAGLRTPIVWIDVEPVPHFDWSDDTTANAAVVQGAAKGYRDAGYAIGFYSTPHLWQEVVGDLRLGVPEWRAAGQTSLAEALSRCGADWSFQGGNGAFGQWVEASSDRNVTCPGTSGDLGRWFVQY